MAAAIHIITIDGVRALSGTGTEDDFNGGWYFEDGPYATPFSARIESSSFDDSHTGRATMVRWHVAYDVLECQKSFDFDFEC